MTAKTKTDTPFATETTALEIALRALETLPLGAATLPAAHRATRQAAADLRGAAHREFYPVVRPLTADDIAAFTWAEPASKINADAAYLQIHQAALTVAPGVAATIRTQNARVKLAWLLDNLDTETREARLVAFDAALAGQVIATGQADDASRVLAEVLPRIDERIAAVLARHDAHRAEEAARQEAEAAEAAAARLTARLAGVDDLRQRFDRLPSAAFARGEA